MIPYKECPRCKVKLEKDKNIQRKADELMESWGFKPFEHTDLFCKQCGYHVTLYKGEPISAYMPKRPKPS